MNVQAIIDLARNPDLKEQVAHVIYRLKPDPWFYQGMVWHAWAYRAHEIWFSAWTFLMAYARTVHPKIYLETGVRKGGSMSMVLSQSPQTQCIGFDEWPPVYAPIEGWPHIPATEELVRAQLQDFGTPSLEFIKGDSKQTLPEFFKARPLFRCDLFFVDGEHSDAGARSDLDIAFQVADVVLFDDICHPSHPELRKAWSDTYRRYEHDYPLQYLDTWNVGTAVAFHKNCLH